MNDDYSDDTPTQNNKDDFDPLFDLEQDDPEPESKVLVQEEKKEAFEFLQEPPQAPQQAELDNQVKIHFKIPQESIDNIELKFSIDSSIQHVKEQISINHPLKPSKDKQKLLFGGKFLIDEQTLDKIFQTKNWKEETQNFHLIINQTQTQGRSRENSQQQFVNNQNQQPVEQLQRNDQPNNGQPQQQEERANDANNAPERQPNQEAQQNTRQPTKDEYLLSKRYLKFEKTMMKEYQKELFGVKSSRHLSKISKMPQESLNTNLDPMSNAMMTRLPLMDRGFQQRLELYSAANNIKTHVIDFNENIAIRFLGYDSILQFTLLMKLFGFMILFGMNAPGNMKWVCLTMLIAYYFHHVRSLYLEHYEQQRRLLNLQQNQQDENAPRAAMQEFLENNLLGIDREVLDELRQQQRGTESQQIALFERLEERRIRRLRNRNPIFGPIQQGLRTALILSMFFIISLHHDFVEPRLQNFDQQRQFRNQQRERIRKRKEERAKEQAEKAAKKEAERLKKQREEKEKEKQQAQSEKQNLVEETNNEEIKVQEQEEIKKDEGPKDGVPFQRKLETVVQSQKKPIETIDLEPPAEEDDLLFGLQDDLSNGSKQKVD